MKRTHAGTVALLAAFIAIAGAARAASWTEIPDAGDATAPQLTRGSGTLTSIVGNRGGAADPADAFTFATDGVTGLSISAFIGLPSFAPQQLTLWDTDGVLLRVGLPQLTGVDLAPGAYVIQVSAFEAEAPDMALLPYTISFGQPVSFAQAPEPGVLLLGGVALLLTRLPR